MNLPEVRVRFGWTFEREAKWMLWMLLIPAILALLSGLVPLLRRHVGLFFGP